MTAQTAMQVSIVIPTYNEAAALPQLLQDLAAFRTAGHEVLLVDAGSVDGTAELARPHVDQVIQSPKGRARQLNAGAAAARGDVLWFLHADSRVAPGTLEPIRHAVTDSRSWGRFDVRLSGKQWPFRVIERMMNWRSCISGIATGDQGIFVQRHVFEAVGGFPDIPLMEDIRLSKQLKRHQRPCCVHTPKLGTSSRRWERRGIWRTLVLMWRLRLAHAMGTDPATLARHYR